MRERERDRERERGKEGVREGRSERGWGAKTRDYLGSRKNRREREGDSKRERGSLQRQREGERCVYL